MITGEWSPTEDERIRKLWDEGHSATKIGVAVGRTKNAVIGRAHRLGFPGRASPVVRTGNPPTPRPVRMKVTLPVLKSVEAPAVMVPVKPPAPVFVGPVSECCYPIGEPRTPGFRYCDDPTVPGGSYCETHWKLCHTGKAKAAA